MPNPSAIAGQLFSKSLVMPVSSNTVIDLEGKGFTRFQGSVGSG